MPNHKSLLLIDADSDCAPIISQAARKAGYAVSMVKTSREAFVVIRNDIRHLDLIVLDVDPGAHGLALLEAISACAERPPIVVVTALEETYMKPIAARYGAAACLGKPLRLRRFLATVQDVSAHRALTCNRWGSLVPLSTRNSVDLKKRFRGIATKLSPSGNGRSRKTRT